MFYQDQNLKLVKWFRDWGVQELSQQHAMLQPKHYLEKYMMILL